jgi:hypothetical protein
VTFNHRLFGEFVFADSASKSTQTYFYSTVRSIEKDNQLPPAIVKSSMQDVDRDGMAERWNISMRIKKPQGSSGSNGVLRSANIVIGFKWESYQLVKTEMESLAVINVHDYTGGSKLSASSIKTVGTLELKQDAPSKMTRGMNRRYNDDIFLNLEYESLNTLLTERYYSGERNDTTVYNYESFVQLGSSSLSYIDFSFIINIPRDQTLVYAPGMLQILKFAWIQYYSFLILIYFFLYFSFYGFIVKNKVFDSVEITSINLHALVNEKKRVI